MPKKYEDSAIAKMRVATGLSQTEAALKMAINRWYLSSIECGARHATPGVMRRMVELYGKSTAEVLSACTASFEYGTLMRKHRLRQAKVVQLEERAKRAAKEASSSGANPPM